MAIMPMLGQMVNCPECDALFAEFGEHPHIIMDIEGNEVPFIYTPTGRYVDERGF